MKTVSEFYRLAGGLVRVDWEQEELRSILGPALAHRLVPADEARFRIRVRRDLREWPAAGDNTLQVKDDETGLTVLDGLQSVSHRVEAGNTEAEFACATPLRLPGAERATPFRFILQRWLASRQVQILHGGAVGLPGHGAVLLAARGGGGKSNTMLACLNSPLQVLGEDYLAVDDAAHPRVWALYNTAKLHPPDLARFPELAREVDRVPDTVSDKLVLQLAARHGERWADGLPLRAILVLKITGSRASRIVPAKPMEAVKEMLASPLMILPAARRPLFEFINRLAHSLPVHRLELGTEPPQIAAAIHQFVTRPPS